jgi:hypothetical protein
MTGPTPLPVPAGYVNHIHAVADGKGNVYVLVILESAGNNDGAYLLRRNPSGAYELLQTFLDNVVGKNGYGAVAVGGSVLVCLLSVREKDGSQRPVEYTIPLPE